MTDSKEIDLPMLAEVVMDVIVAHRNLDCIKLREWHLGSRRNAHLRHFFLPYGYFKEWVPSTICACTTATTGHSISKTRYLNLLLPSYFRVYAGLDNNIQPWHISVLLLALRESLCEPLLKSYYLDAYVLV